LVFALTSVLKRKVQGGGANNKEVFETLQNAAGKVRFPGSDTKCRSWPDMPEQQAPSKKGSPSKRLNQWAKKICTLY
jgi:hypothetical protein